MKLHQLSLIAALLLLAAPAVADQADPPQSRPAPGGRGHFADGQSHWAPHPEWRGDIHHFDHEQWRGGHWWHGGYEGRIGWWWIVGPDWYWFAEPIYPYPDAFTPAGSAAGFWYWCDEYQQYYPYVGACPSGWRAVPIPPN